MEYGTKILVVDGDAIVRNSIVLLLKHAGHQVTLVSGGQEALTALVEKQFDLVITDFSMPNMLGDELVARIRQRWPEQCTVMVSGFVEEYRVFGRESGGVDAFLLKPFTFRELLATIEQVPDGRLPSFRPEMQLAHIDEQAGETVKEAQ